MFEFKFTKSKCVRRGGRKYALSVYRAEVVALYERKSTAQTVGAG